MPENMHDKDKTYVNLIEGSDLGEVLRGTRLADKILGLDGEDLILGRSGNDLLYGGGADDRVFGGFGADLVDGGKGDDWLQGGFGRDSILGRDGGDTMFGDFEFFGPAELRVLFHAKKDMFSDYMDGGDGGDWMVGGFGGDVMLGGEGNDVMFGDFGWFGPIAPTVPPIVTTQAPSPLQVGPVPVGPVQPGPVQPGPVQPDFPIAPRGMDWNDKMYGGNGSDWMFGGLGNDVLKGSSGDDWLFGDTSVFGARTPFDITVADLEADAADPVRLAALRLDGMPKWNDKLFGGIGDDVLFGDIGNDKLVGGVGNDILIGGIGNDRILGDGRDAKKFAKWVDDFDDYINAGAGNDRVKAGRGEDEVVHRMAENTGARDIYDGGRGTDALVLKFTLAEWQRADVQADVADFLAFLATDPGPREVFHFTSMDLHVRRFEDLRVFVDGVELDPADEPVTANDDAVTISEDGPAADFASVLDNDDVPDLAYSVALVSPPAAGTFVFIPGLPGAPIGTYGYDPNGAFEHLAPGQSEDVTFTYEVTDSDGDTDQATVTITVEGVNDDPVAVDDTNAGDPVIESGWLNPGGDDTATGDVLANDSDVDLGDTLAVTHVDAGTGETGSAMDVTDFVQIILGKYGALAMAPDGTWSYTLDDTDVDTALLQDGDLAQEVFTYTVTDSFGGTDEATLTIDIQGGTDALDFAESIGDLSFARLAPNMVELTFPNASVLPLTGFDTLNFPDASVDLGSALFVSEGATGTSGDDVILGTVGEDIISGGAGADLIAGGAARDFIFGEAGNDTIYGGSGSDILNGGDDDDLLTGGDDADFFVFDADDGTNVITDFAAEDTISLTDSGSFDLSFDGTDSTIDYTDGSTTTTITVLGYGISIADFGTEPMLP